MARPHLRDPKLEQFWRAKLKTWLASGLNIRAFCRKHRLTEPSFYAWRRELAARDGTAIPMPVVPPKRVVPPKPAVTNRRTPTRSCAAGPAPRPRFVALRVVPDAPLELVLRTGHVLRVPPGYDASHLRAVVAALAAAPC